MLLVRPVMVELRDFLRAILLLRRVLQKANQLCVGAGLVHFLQLVAAVNALPDNNGGSFCTFCGLGLNDAPATVVKAVRELETGHLRVGPHVRFKGLMLSNFTRVA